MDWEKSTRIELDHPEGKFKVFSTNNNTRVGQKDGSPSQVVMTTFNIQAKGSS
jgi:hypothetical protein